MKHLALITLLLLSVPAYAQETDIKQGQVPIACTNSIPPNCIYEPVYDKAVGIHYILNESDKVYIQKWLQHAAEELFTLSSESYEQVIQDNADKYIGGGTAIYKSILGEIDALDVLAAPGGRIVAQVEKLPTFEGDSIGSGYEADDSYSWWLYHVELLLTFTTNTITSKKQWTLKIYVPISPENGEGFDPGKLRLEDLKIRSAIQF